MLSITSRGAEEVSHLPPIEENQFVTRASQPSPLDNQAETTGREDASEEQVEVEQDDEARGEELMCVTEEQQISETSENTEQTRTDTDTDTAVDQQDVTDAETAAETNEEPATTTSEEPQQQNEPQEETKNVDKDADVTEERKRKKKSNEVNISRKTASDDQEDPLISKLDKKIDKELRALQGNNQDDDDDDDDDDVEDETLSDLLHGQRAKELDEFLKI